VPSTTHEAPLTVLREVPSLVPTLLREALGVEVPAFEDIEVAESDFTQMVPTEFRADLVVVLRGPPPEREPVMGVIVEIQRKRDDRKRLSWPLYLAGLHARLGCQTCLVVVATDDRVAEWARTPIVGLQPRSPLTPIVLGPAGVPHVVGDAARARPWLAVLSAMLHAHRPEGVAIAVAALEAIEGLRDDHATLAYDLIMASVDADVRLMLEARMQPRNYEYQSDFARKYFGEGKEAGRLQALRHVLGEVVGQRLGALSEMRRARIEEVQDAEALERVLVKVAAATDPGDVERLIDAL
jgi:hypothetical protein